MRDILTCSPSLSEYRFLRDQVGLAWKRARKELADAGDPIPELGTEELDRATGRIRRKLPFEPPNYKTPTMGDFRVNGLPILLRGFRLGAFRC